MKVKSLPTTPLPLKEDPDRPKGLHLSTIITSMMKALKPEIYGLPMAQSKVHIGQAFDTVLEKELASVLLGPGFRPSAIQHDGVWCSPNRIRLDPWSVDEFKLTWYSASKQCPTDPVFWPWVVQIKAYCYVVGTFEAFLTVLYVNGDYKPPKPMEPQTFHLTFTEHELKENWDMLINHAKHVGLLHA
jgi:hypothetical protein